MYPLLKSFTDSRFQVRCPALITKPSYRKLKPTKQSSDETTHRSEEHFRNRALSESDNLQLAQNALWPKSVLHDVPTDTVVKNS